MIEVEAAGLTDVGKRRKGNEDSLFLDEELNLYVVADGMGGHQAGEVASGLVVETIHEYMGRLIKGGEPEEPDEIDLSVSEQANHLLASIRLANSVVFDLARKKEAYRGMGSTVSAVYFTGSTLIASNVGDSPIYLVRDGKIEPLYRPHTVLAEQAELDPDLAERLGERYKHILTRAMGINETVEPEICEIQGFKDDILVLCSDGLSDKVSPEETRDLVMKKSADDAAGSLVALANDRGGDDNITVIVLKIKKVGEGGFLGMFSKLLGK